MFRRRLLAILAALGVPVLALGQYQGFEPDSGFDFSGGAFGTRRSSGVMSLLFRQTGAGFDCTGATSCIAWDGAALTDSAGLAWSMTGTVPQVASTALPVLSAQGAAGPFAAGNYYQNGTGADALDADGNTQRWGCVAFVPTSFTGTGVLQANSTATAQGNVAYLAATSGNFTFGSYAGSNNTVVASPAATLGAYNVACWWRNSASSISAKINLATTVTNAASAGETTGTTSPLTIGQAAGANPFVGQILHITQGLGACPTPPSPFAATCEGWATYQMKRQFGMIGTRGEEVSLTRATTATATVNGLVWNVPAAVPRIEAAGLLAERTSTNAALQSSTSCVANAVQAPWALGGAPTCTSDVAVAPDGTITMDEWAGAASTDTVAQSTTLASSATATGSVWMAKASGTGAASMGIVCTTSTMNTCTCQTSDGSACTATVGAPSAAGCLVSPTAIGTTPIRVVAVGTCAAAATAWTFRVYPGQLSVAPGTTRFWGAQLETGTTPTSYLPTAGTAVARNADVPSVPWPTMSDINRWCVKATVTPYGGAAWNSPSLSRIFSAGTSGAANSTRVLQSSSTVITFSVYDGSGAARSAAWTHGYSPGSVHAVTACNDSGALRLYSDGALVASSSVGGTGLWSSAPAALLIGTSSATGAESDAYSRDVKVCKSASPGACK